MTTFSDEETDKLIELIRQHPTIFNSQLDSYRDEHLRDNIWRNIAESINKAESECRKKWKLIKDSYNRHKRNKKLSPGSSVYRKNSKWQLFERLRFLENTQSCTFIKEENTEIGHDDIPLEVTDEYVLNNSREAVLTPGTSTSIQEIPPSSNKPTKKISKRKRLNDDFIKSRERHEFGNRRLETLTAEHPVDEIFTFAKYLEMSLRKLSSRSRALAKHEIFNVISKYEITDMDGQSEVDSFSPISTGHETENDQFDHKDFIKVEFV